MTTTGDLIENPVTGERAVVRVGTVETGGAYAVVDLYIRPGGAVVGEHWHPAMEERFTVLRGRVGFQLAGQEETAETGSRSMCRQVCGTIGGTPVRRRRAFGSTSVPLPASKP